MHTNKRTEDARFESLPFAFRNAGGLISSDPETLMRQGTEFFGSGNHANRVNRITPQAEMKVVETGRSQILAVKSTPCYSREEGDESTSTLAMPFAGNASTYRDWKTDSVICPGDIFLNPRNGGTVSTGYFSGIIITIEHRQLERTMKAMGGAASLQKTGLAVVIKSDETNKSSGIQGRFWSFFRYMDQLLQESEHLPAGMGLDEQIYRLLSIALFEQSGTLENAQKRWSLKRNDWQHPLDELVDYIKENANLGFTLTDLEEQSHYSARQLQNLFKEKFDCTPMQFVRRQRLTSAMEKLQTADYDATVTSIGRDCGYRFTSNFTTDFHRQFGVTPSTVLRASRGGGEK